jgi:hypothetical protein
MLKQGIAPRPEHEINYEISLLDNLKQKILAPVDLDDDKPSTIEGYEKLLAKNKE